MVQDVVASKTKTSNEPYQCRHFTKQKQTKNVQTG